MLDPVRYESRQQLAARSGLSERFFEKLATDGGGPPFIKAGRRVLYRTNESDEWLAARLIRSTSEAIAADRGAA